MIKLIAFDLDGTLLTTDKKITPRTYDALKNAAGQGVHIVPATGRFLRTVPQEIKDMDFVDCIISINGAYVIDMKTGEEIYRSEIPVNEAIDIMSFFDTMPVAYDCYMNNDSFINQKMMDEIESYVDDRFYLDLVWKHRKGVPELKEHIRASGHDIQKIMAYTKDMEIKRYLMDNLESMFPGLKVTSSIKNNVEINASGADKGKALEAVAQYFHIDISETMGFGDSYNDIPLLRAAGTGVCMGNGNDVTKSSADIIAPSNDDDGVAQIIEEMVLIH
ncbi:MAG: Cof-type HAD-IIB family hydrolase [Lachnospiraceae bacterium]|nr:Cof-type HAD-IIB family hydrolase [Lachnospiraceae bacterium]